MVRIVLFLTAIIFSDSVSGIRPSKLTAVSISPYTEHLYQKVRSKYRPTDRDWATKSLQNRQSICQDITESGFFNEYAMDPLKLTKSTVQRIHEEYHSLYDEIFRPRKNPIKRLYRAKKYKNKFAKRLLGAASHIDDNHSAVIFATEWVFVCLLQGWSNEEKITPLYVSKEYNVFGHGSRYAAGRFIFWENKDMMLAEEPARAYVSPDFNIELHYQHVREFHQPAQHDLIDPVCRLARHKISDQHHRLCTTVLKSPYFNGKILHVVPVHHDEPCIESTVWFQTPTAVGRRRGRLRAYYERLLPCLAVEKTDNASGDVRRTLYYISRAYTSYEVFVYARPSMHNPLHLEVLMTNVSMVRESEVEEAHSGHDRGHLRGT